MHVHPPVSAAVPSNLHLSCAICFDVCVGRLIFAFDCWLLERENISFVENVPAGAAAAEILGKRKKCYNF
jgi:hypothetical protein